MDLIGDLFAVERAARAFSVEQRLALRQAQSAAVLEKLGEKLLDWKQQLLPKASHGGGGKLRAEPMGRAEGILFPPSITMSVNAR